MGPARARRRGVALAVAVAMAAACAPGQSNAGLADVAALATEDTVASDAAAFGDFKDAAATAVDDVAVPLSGALADASGALGADLRGAELRQRLATKLDEHTFLVGITIEQRLAGRGDAFEAARAALDDSSAELADLIGSVEDVPDERRDTFLALWRGHSDHLVAYSRAADAGAEAATQRPLEGLDNFREDVGLLVEDLTTGAMPDGEMADRLGEHVDTALVAVNRLVAGDLGAFEALDGAALIAARQVGVPLAEAIAAARHIEGVDTPGAKLRGELAVEMDGHVWLVALLAEQRLAGADQAIIDAARAALEANANALADVVDSAGTVRGDARERFLGLWRRRIAALAAYVDAAASGDDQGRQQAAEELQQVSAQIGGFFADVTEGVVEADEVSTSLEELADRMTAAIDALAGALSER